MKFIMFRFCFRDMLIQLHGHVEAVVCAVIEFYGVILRGVSNILA